ncbi:MAG: DUF1830 domain-containing protein [Cyanobacteria bacterium P01_A01_bin.105]
MAQVLDPLPSDGSEDVLCCYVNVSSKIQVARITNIPNWYFERVVFPGQRLIFEALVTAQLEIHTGMMASSILSDTIPCERLMIEAPTVSDVIADVANDAANAASGEAGSIVAAATVD